MVNGTHYHATKQLLSPSLLGYYTITAPSPADVFHMNINSGYAITGDITTPRVMDAFHMNINSSYGPIGDITTRPVAEDPAGTVG